MPCVLRTRALLVVAAVSALLVVHTPSGVALPSPDGSENLRATVGGVTTSQEVLGRFVRAIPEGESGHALKSGGVLGDPSNVGVDPVTSLFLAAFGKKIVTGLAEYAGDKVVGWVLHDVLKLKKDDPNEKLMKQLEAMTGMLEDIKSGIAALDSRVKELEQRLVDELMKNRWNQLVADVREPISRLEERHERLLLVAKGGASDSNKEEVARLVDAVLDINQGVGVDLRILHKVLTNYMESQGMLKVWGETIANRAVHDWAATGYQYKWNEDRAVGYYQDMEDFFSRMISLQLRGLNLLVEAYHSRGQKAEAEHFATMVRGNIAEQSEVFVSTAEAFVHAFWLHGEMGGSWNMPAVLNRADLYTARVVGSETRLVVRLWTSISPPNESWARLWYGLAWDQVKDVTLQVHKGDEVFLATTPTGVLVEYPRVSMTRSGKEYLREARMQRFNYGNVPYGSFQLVDPSAALPVTKSGYRALTDCKHMLSTAFGVSETTEGRAFSTKFYYQC